MTRHDFAHDGKEHAVRLGDASSSRIAVTVVSDGREESTTLEAQDLGAGRWLVRQGDAVVEARVERGADGALRVTLPGGVVELERLDPFRDVVRRGRAGAAGPRKVNAPIPGRVVDVLVAEGDSVTQGQPLVIVEAMKMANELRAPIAGRVTRVLATRGAPVDAGATLVILEA